MPRVPHKFLHRRATPVAHAATWRASAGPRAGPVLEIHRALLESAQRLARPEPEAPPPGPAPRISSCAIRRSQHSGRRL